jgi:hypothetical protein
MYLLSATPVRIALVALGAAAYGCDDASEELTEPPNSASNPVQTATERELRNIAKELFKELEPKLQKNCGNACHDTATVYKDAPIFLAQPDPYASIKKSGFITADPTRSPLVNQGEHLGPALNNFPELSAQVFTWLRIESAAIEKKVLPTSDPVAIKIGSNEIDMSKAGVAGVTIKFDASMPSGLLVISNLKVVVPVMEAKKGVHLVRPLFYRISKDNKLFTDVTDTFSFVDAVFPGGKASRLPPGGVIFAGNGWVPFAAGDKIRIQVDKLEIGAIPDRAKSTICKPGAGAAFNLTLGASLNGKIKCAACHGMGGRTPTINLSTAATQQATCETLAGYINKSAPEKSLLITKLTAPTCVLGHTGGKFMGGDADDFARQWSTAVAGSAIWEVQ